MAQATAAPGSAHSAVAKENKKAIQARNLRTGLLFTAPALIVLAIFVFYPAIKTFITSLTSDRINRAGKFVGFDNYVKLFQSADFWTDVKNTLVYAVLYAPIVVIIALAFALLLNRKDLKFVGFFRTCMVLPVVISLTVAAIAWQFILSPSLGLIPYWVSLLGGPSHLDLLGTRETSMATIVFITVWKNFGYFMVIFLAGLQTIDDEIYEAAAIDGVNAWQKFWKITFPLIGPFFTINLVLSMKNALGTFDQVVALTEGGPNSSTETVTYLIWKGGLTGGEYAYQTANAVLFFIVLAIIAFVQLRISRSQEQI